MVAIATVPRTEAPILPLQVIAFIPCDRCMPLWNRHSKRVLRTPGPVVVIIWVLDQPCRRDNLLDRCLNLRERVQGS